MSEPNHTLNPQQEVSSDDVPGICVTLCYSPAPRQVQQCTLALPKDSTVADALQHPDAHELLSVTDDEAIDAEQQYGVWNAKVGLDTVLNDGDRLEVYRPLQVDPKVARRERFASQGGAKTAGLFKKRRPGAKAGY